MGQKSAPIDERVMLAQTVHRLRERFGPLAAAQMLENAALDLQREAEKAESAKTTNEKLDN